MQKLNGQRLQGQSQLDYLWVNFGQLAKLEKAQNILRGYDSSGECLFELDFEGSSSSSGDNNSIIEDFGKKVVNGESIYYIRLSDGSELTAPAESQDLLELQEQVNQNTEALQMIDKNIENSLSQMLKLSKEYTDSKLIDVTEIQKQINNVSNDLQLLKGSEEEDGSILNIVTTQINNAFVWQEL